MNNKFKQIYYSDDGYWRGKSAINKLAKKAGSTKDRCREMVINTTTVSDIFTSTKVPKYILRPNSSMSLYATPNDMHQTDILFLPHDKYKRKTYKYALCIVDVASRYKAAYQLTSKNSTEVAKAFDWIYENTELKYLKMLICDEGTEFYGEVTRLMKKHGVNNTTRRFHPAQKPRYCRKI